MNTKKTIHLRHVSEHNPKALRSHTTLMPWIVWGLAAAFYAYTFIQQAAFNAYLPAFIRDFQPSAEGISFASSCFYYAYASMQIPGGAFVDWLGPRKLASFGLLIMTVATFCLGLSQGVFGIGLARFFLGLGAAFAFICCMQLIIFWFPPYRFTLIAGLTNLAGYVGGTLAGTPVTNAVESIGWRNTVLFSGVAGLILTALVAFFVQNKPYNYQKKKHKHKPRVPLPHIFTGLKCVVGNGKSWLNGLYVSFMIGPTYAFSALWGSPFLAYADHLSRKLAATAAVSAVFAGVALGSPFFGWLSEYLNKRQVILVFSALGSCLASSALIYVNQGVSFTFVMAACFLFGLFQSAHVINFAIAKDLNPKKYSGSAIGFTNMLGVLSGAILQPVVGFILDHTHPLIVNARTFYTTSNYHFALSVLPLSQLLAFVIALTALRDKK